MPAPVLLAISAEPCCKRDQTGMHRHALQQYTEESWERSLNLFAMLLCLLCHLLNMFGATFAL